MSMLDHKRFLQLNEFAAADHPATLSLPKGPGQSTADTIPEIPLSGGISAPPSQISGQGDTTIDWAAAVPVQAMEDVMAERMRAIVDLGHTPQADLERSPAYLLRFLNSMMQAAYEDCTLADRARDYRSDAAAQSEHLQQARIKAVRACAIGLAAIDRIDAEINQIEIVEDTDDEIAF